MLGTLLVAGCAVPVPLQIASWALDGISLIATKKSVSDHGISLAMEQDCALWRGFTDGDICRENTGDIAPASPEKDTIQVASSGDPDGRWQIAAITAPEVYPDSSVEH